VDKNMCHVSEQFANDGSAGDAIDNRTPIISNRLMTIFEHATFLFLRCFILHIFLRFH